MPSALQESALSPAGVAPKQPSNRHHPAFARFTCSVFTRNPPGATLPSEPGIRDPYLPSAAWTKVMGLGLPVPPLWGGGVQCPPPAGSLSRFSGTRSFCALLPPATAEWNFPPLLVAPPQKPLGCPLPSLEFFRPSQPVEGVSPPAPSLATDFFFNFKVGLSNM